MTTGDGWTPPPPPPPAPPPPPGPAGQPSSLGPPRRYATKWIWFGVGAGIVATNVLPLAGFATIALELRALTAVVFLAGFLATLVLGVVLTARKGSPAQRGFGLGLIIGWALAPIVFAGVCTIVILTSYQVAG